MATQTITGEIGGRDVEITVQGPEAQELDDDTDELGSDVVAYNVQMALDDIAHDLTDGSLHQEADE